jgi:hypothetical protein
VRLLKSRPVQKALAKAREDSIAKVREEERLKLLAEAQAKKELMNLPEKKPPRKLA